MQSRANYSRRDQEKGRHRKPHGGKVDAAVKIFGNNSRVTVSKFSGTQEDSDSKFRTSR